MSDVFISYAREDRDTAHALAEALQADGHAVWWDRQLAGGSDFTAEIERQLARSRVVLVLWSAASVQSGFVRDESTRARDAGKLLPLRIEAELPLPLGFGSLHTLDLTDWDGDADAEAYAVVQSAVRARLASGPQPLPPSSVPRAPRWRRWRWPAAGLAGAAALAAGLWLALAPDDDGQAQAHLQAGLAAHFAREPNLEVARNAYLAALRVRPDMAVAHYYLGLAYGELKLRPAALTQFVAALANAEELDEGQRSEAVRQRDLLSAPEPEPLARAAASDPAPAIGEPPHSSAAPPTPAAAGTPPIVAPAPPPAAALPASAPLEPAPAGLVRVAAPEAQQRRAQAQASALLGSDEAARAAAASTLSIDETLAADALPALLQGTLLTLARSPGSDDARQSVAATLRVLQAASPAVLREHAQPAGRVADAGRTLGGASARSAEVLAARLAQVSASSSQPVVFLQIADERQRALARDVAARLAAAGYRTPAIENTGPTRAPARTELRLQGASDPALARWMAQHLTKVVQAEVPIQPLRRARPANDTFEIWFGAPLCVSRVVPACNPG